MVVTDAGYGKDTGFRDGATALQLPYVAGIHGMTGLWAPGTGSLPAEELTAWPSVTWREGTAGKLAPLRRWQSSRVLETASNSFLSLRR